MDIDKVFYIFFYQQAAEKFAPRRMVVFYSKDTMSPILAYKLGPRNSVPKEYMMLEHITITLNYFRALERKYQELGILQPYGAGIPEGKRQPAS